MTAIPLWGHMMFSHMRFTGDATSADETGLGTTTILPLVSVVFALSLLFGFVLNSLLGEILLLLVILIALTRFPWREAIWSTALAVVLYLIIQIRHSLAAFSGWAAWLDVGRGLSLFIFVAFATLLVRSRAETIRQLRATQKRLEAEMQRSATLAAAQERSRIARDLHDVLAHSLTLVSIQVQATRQVAVTHPDKIPAMLEHVAMLVRESIGESRRVVGLLRDPEPGVDAPFPQRLREVAAHFAERTGIHFTWQESGTPLALNPAQEEALRYALQEAMTNAFRHGAAPLVAIELVWSPKQVHLQIADNGTPQATTTTGGGNGLRGMRERMTMLAGEIQAQAQESGGFVVNVTIPRDEEVAT